ncbi:MAG TPA: methyltransferase domain-containing protein [Methylophilaceae bacterium]|jgi:hypothetical protein
MPLPRLVNPETLDHLAENDPLAIGSRRDLRRVNRIMGSGAILLKAIKRLPQSPKRILELGAGDGSLMLDIANKLAKQWPNVQLTLLDRQNLVSEQTIRAFHHLGWRVEILQADVLDWIAHPVEMQWDLSITNLFVHHFEGDELSNLLAGIAARTQYFIACEPRRAWLPLAGSHLIGLLGTNAVTREDAVLSVHAGFRDHELSALWPQQEHQQNWWLTEYAAGLFSHCLFAVNQQPHIHANTL